MYFEFLKNLKHHVPLYGAFVKTKELTGKTRQLLINKCVNATITSKLITVINEISMQLIKVTGTPTQTGAKRAS